MSKQEFILALLKEGREWLIALAPFLSTLIAWFLPSPLPKKNQLRKPE